MKFKLIQDKYRNNRGGHSQFINIYCAACNTYLLLYQKDGFKRQQLKRIYIDRIIAPQNAVAQSGKLICPNCEKVIGLPIMYQKEDRSAISLKFGDFIRRPSTGLYPPKNLSKKV